MKRVLVCGPRMPEHDREGGSKTAYQLVETLVRAGWAVTYIAQAGDGQERYAHELRQMGVQIYSGPRTRTPGDDYLPNPATLVADGRFDLALFIFWRTAEWLLPSLRALSPRTKIVVWSGDLHFLRRLRELYSPGRNGPGMELPTAIHIDEMARELNTYASVDAVLAVSQKEADLLNDFVGQRASVYLLPLTDDTPGSPLPFEQRRGLFFLGNFQHAPNVEALIFLCQAILPRVDPTLLAEHPMYIVGNALTSDLADVSTNLPNSRAVGWVPSVVPYVHTVRASVIPLLSGAGTKSKLVQTLMAGTPSVSTPVGVEGMQLLNGRDVIIADDPEAFAAGITVLLSDPNVWSRISLAGQNAVMSGHSADVVEPQFLSIVGGLMASAAIP